MPTVLLLILLAITIVLIAIVIGAPRLTMGRAGKVLAFIALFIFPVAWSFMGAAEHMDRSKQTSFCLSCHVMEPYGKSLRVASYAPRPDWQGRHSPQTGTNASE